MKKHISYLPASARRYSVSIDGKIFGLNNEEIIPTNSDSGPQVELLWINGLRKYNVAILVLVAFRGWFIPEHLLNEVEPIFLNKNKKDCSLSNLTYCFTNSCLAVEELEGYFYIPNFSKYAINRDGDLINVETLKHKTWSITLPDPVRNSQGGYRYNRAIRDDGVSVILLRHRALWTAFNKFGPEINSNVINHLNGIAGDDRLDNLELTTYLENNLHAVLMGLRKDNRPVLSLNLITKEENKFSSLTQCARHHGFSHCSHISARIKTGSIYTDFLMFKYDDGIAWPKYDLKGIKPVVARNANEIIARNVFTGQIIVFNGTMQGSMACDVKPGTILSHVKNGTRIPINGWNFKYTHDQRPWPMFNEWHLKIFKKFPLYPSDGLFVKDLNTNEEEFFESVALACQKLKLHKRIIYDCAKANRSYKSKLTFKFVHLKDPSHPIE